MTKAPVMPFDSVVRAAKMCISGARCEGSPGVKHCPYYNQRTGNCEGDYRKDLLKWALYLKEEHDRSGSV